jgi:hypothetical protein
MNEPTVCDSDGRRVAQANQLLEQRLKRLYGNPKLTFSQLIKDKNSVFETHFQPSNDLYSE